MMSRLMLGLFRLNEWLNRHIVEVLVALTIGCLLLMAMTGCARRPIEQRVTHDTVTVQRVDTVALWKWQVDTVMRWDSVFVRLIEKGDTIREERVEYRYRDRVKVVHDSIRIVDMDSIYIAKQDTVVRTVNVEKRLGGWSRFVLAMGYIGMGMLLLLIGCGVWKLYRKLS